VLTAGTAMELRTKMQDHHSACPGARTAGGGLLHLAKRLNLAASKTRPLPHGGGRCVLSARLRLWRVTLLRRYARPVARPASPRRRVEVTAGRRCGLTDVVRPWQDMRDRRLTLALVKGPMEFAIATLIAIISLGIAYFAYKGQQASP